MGLWSSAFTSPSASSLVYREVAAMVESPSSQLPVGLQLPTLQSIEVALICMCLAPAPTFWHATSPRACLQLPAAAPALSRPDRDAQIMA